MLKKKITMLLAIVCCAVSMQALATDTMGLPQLYENDKLIEASRDKVAGGEGTLYGRFAFQRHTALEEQAIKEIGWMTLQPGHSIGFHRHTDNEDTYIIVKGVGEFIGNDGVKHVVKAGDVTIARPGDGHALKNIGEEPLEFLDVIAKNDTYAKNHPTVKK